MVRVEDVEARTQEAVRRAERAVLAIARRVRVRDVPARGRDERSHVLRACLARRRLDCGELDITALDGHAPEGLAEERLDEVGVWRQVVHPLPPPELAERLQDTVAVESQSVSRPCETGTSDTYKVSTKENRKLNRSAAISAFGDIAATAWPMVV